MHLQPDDPRWFIDFYTGMRTIINVVVQLNPEMYEPAKQSKYNLEGSTINHLLCKLENKVLMAAVDYLKKKASTLLPLILMGL